MRRRCRSWALTPDGLGAVKAGTPGADRALWRLCRNRVEPGQIRCEQCYEELSLALDPAVRRMLAAEGGLPRLILDRLLSDSDVQVLDLVAERGNEQLGTDVFAEAPGSMHESKNGDDLW